MRKIIRKIDQAGVGLILAVVIVIAAVHALLRALDAASDI